jgi:hypothetical protein
MVMKKSGDDVIKVNDNKYIKFTDGIPSLTTKGQTLVDDIMAFLTGNEDKVFSYKDLAIALAKDKPVKYGEMVDGMLMPTVKNREVKSVMPFLMAQNKDVVDDASLENTELVAGVRPL